MNCAEFQNSAESFETIFHRRFLFFRTEGKTRGRRHFLSPIRRTRSIFFRFLFFNINFQDKSLYFWRGHRSPFRPSIISLIISHYYLIQLHWMIVFRKWSEKYFLTVNFFLGLSIQPKARINWLPDSLSHLLIWELLRLLDFLPTRPVLFILNSSSWLDPLDST